MNPEWEIADYYRRYRLLARPSIDLVTFLKHVAVALIVTIIISCVVAVSLVSTNVIEYENVLNYVFLIWAATVCVFCIVFNKIILIECIELYQHYASEETRRKCVCMPSCSVYAIMAIRKYNTFKALYMIMRRLSNCYGNICIVDYP